MMLKRRNLKQTEGQKCSSFNINNTATFKAVMNKVSVQSLNECFNISGEDFILVGDDYEPCSYCSFVGEKHPQFGIAKTKEQKEHQSKMIEKWWKSLTDEEKESISKKRAKSIKEYWKSYTDDERKLLRNWSSPKKYGIENHRYGKQSASKGKIWITNGDTNKMVAPDEIPEGWHKGRVNVVSAEGKERLKNLTSQRNKNGELGWTVRKETTTT
jgi:hypothetical protein